MSRDLHAMSIGFGLGALAVLVVQTAASAWRRHRHHKAERARIARREATARWMRFKDEGRPYS